VHKFIPLLFAVACSQAEPFHRAELVFPLERWHNHSSSVVELPGGDLLVCWYNGSGERTADDVKVEAARLRHGAKEWGPRFTLADTPGFPDTNPALFVDRKQRLWLLWQAIIANEWHTALTQARIASKYDGAGVPKWDVSEPLLLKPLNFAERVKQAIADWPEPHRSTLIQRAGDKYFSRMGWMTRAHPVQLPSGRILVPLYSDGYSFSLVAISDDDGRTWSSSEPIIGPGAVQPTIARRKDSALVAYMRDNGPPPKRVLVSTSKDDGVTWTYAVDTDIPNSGTGLEVVVLRDGTWALINNDTEKGRNVLSVWLSDDEGKTWRWKRSLEREPEGSFHYPSLIQTRDGSLHATYSYFVKEGKSIKHAWFSVDWVKAGDGPR
jgi:predicted neuraminidase